MSTRAMIIVAAGSGVRFEGEKIMAAVAGRPLIAHTIGAVIGTVERCVVVCRHDKMRDIEALGFDCELVPGGPTRTASEMAGLAVVGPDPTLTGIHDGARPAVTPRLIDALFERASSVGGAVPVLEPAGVVIERESMKAIHGVRAVQTPQVFRGAELHAAYGKAARAGVTGQDTVELVTQFSDLRVASVPGDPNNIKVTFPDDLKRLESILTERLRSGPR